MRAIVFILLQICNFRIDPVLNLEILNSDFSIVNAPFYGVPRCYHRENYVFVRGRQTIFVRVEIIL